MFVLAQARYNKRGMMKLVALIMQRKKEHTGGPSQCFEWRDKDDKYCAAYLSKITRSEALQYAWYINRKEIARFDRKTEDILDAYVSKRNTETAKRLIKDVVTIDDFKKVVYDLAALKIKNKAWWAMATEANIDDKVKRYGYGRLA